MVTNIDKLFLHCEQLYDLVKASTYCLCQGDQTKCDELRGKRAPIEVRGLPLPKEYWCSNCKIRVQAEKIIDEVRAMPSPSKVIDGLLQSIANMHTKIGRIRANLSENKKKSLERRNIIKQMQRRFNGFYKL